MTGLTLQETLENTGSLVQNQIQNPYMQRIWEIVTLEFMIKFFVIYFFVIWGALILWVARDISHRTTSTLLQIFCILMIIILTPLGIFLYLLIRPGKTIYEQYYAEIENNLEILSEIVQDRLEGEEKLHCPKCEESIDADFLLCPHCHTTLKHQCISCKKEIRESWTVCPYCQTLQAEKKTKKTAKKTD